MIGAGLVTAEHKRGLDLLGLGLTGRLFERQKWRGSRVYVRARLGKSGGWKRGKILGNQREATTVAGRGSIGLTSPEMNTVAE